MSYPIQKIVADTIADLKPGQSGDVSMSLLNTLRKLRDNPSKIKKHLGICANLKTIEFKSEFRCLASKWPKHSGSLSFPIPHPKGPEGGYFKSINMWDRRTTYGKLRWELLNWAIATLESRGQ